MICTTALFPCLSLITPMPLSQMSVTAPWATTAQTDKNGRPPGVVWLSHDMAPREPYTHNRQAGVPTELYEPSHGEPKRDNLKKGFFSHPDFSVPRQPSSGLNLNDKRHPKVNMISVNGPMPPSYADCGASGFMNGMSAPSKIKQVYGRTVDETWEKLEDLPSILEPVTRIREEFKRQIGNDERHRQGAVAEQKATENLPPAPTHCGGPWADSRERLDNQPQRVKMPTRNRRSLTQQMHKFEMDHTANSFVGSWAGRQGGGAPLLAADGSIITTFSSHPDIHLHNDCNAPGGGVVITGTTALDQQLIKTGLDRQVADNRARRKQSRAREEGRITLDDGGLAALGTTRTTPTWRRFDDSKAPPDHELGKALREQAREQRSLRNQERDNALTSDIDYQPFGKSQIHDDNRRVFATKAYGMGDPASGNPIVGGSLLNMSTWGTPGGGSVAVDYGEGQPRVLPRSFHGEEEQAEIDAQARGDSVWGRPGAGAAIRNKDGTVMVNVQGAAERDFNGDPAPRRNTIFREKVREARQEQTEHIRINEETRKRNHAAEVEHDRKEIGVHMLDTKTRRPKERQGRGSATATIFNDEKSRNRGRIDPMHLQKQIEDGKERRARERQLDRDEEARHLHVAAEQFHTKGRTRQIDPVTDEPTGRSARDPMIHMQERQGKLRLDRDEQAEYKADLDRVVEERAAHRVVMRERKQREEVQHGKRMDEDWLQEYKPTDGRRKIPEDTEYKMLVRNTANLA